MKKAVFLFAAVLLCNLSIAQEKLYLVMELMKVDNSQEAAYADTEDFWEKIHQQRANNEDILGWDLWSLRPGGEDQGYQYATVTLFSTKAAMFKVGNLMANAKAAYPNMTEAELDKKLNGAADTRDLAVRIYLEQIATTKGNFKMDVGTVAFFDWMKVDMVNYAAYEMAEKELFQPTHQAEVDEGTKGSWSLIRYVMPVGSDTYASHMTANMYKNVDQAFAENTGNWNPTKAQQEGMELRDMKMVTLATLEKVVRKQ